MEFQWDERKNQTNIEKHQISFQEAATVFYDPCARVIFDPDHSQEEERFIILGFSSAARILVVCHCYRGPEDSVRIISARKADRFEREQYRSFL